MNRSRLRYERLQPPSPSPSPSHITHQHQPTYNQQEEEEETVGSSGEWKDRYHPSSSPSLPLCSPSSSMCDSADSSATPHFSSSSSSSCAHAQQLPRPPQLDIQSNRAGAQNNHTHHHQQQNANQSMNPKHPSSISHSSGTQPAPSSSSSSNSSWQSFRSFDANTNKAKAKAAAGEVDYGTTKDDSDAMKDRLSFASAPHAHPPHPHQLYPYQYEQEYEDILESIPLDSPNPTRIIQCNGLSPPKLLVSTSNLAMTHHLYQSRQTPDTLTHGQPAPAATAGVDGAGRGGIELNQHENEQGEATEMVGGGGRIEKYNHWGSKFLPGPPWIRNILGNELCERFSYYGLRAILVLYFQSRLNWSRDFSISMFSYAAALAYFMPLLGGYVSDTYLGKFHTILIFSLIYVAGGVLLSCAAINGLVWLTILGLVCIGIGTGGIKPCVSSFGADQFTQGHIVGHEELKKREHEISSFFHFFYFAINLGSVCSFIATPLLREFAGYAIAFGVPAILLAIATLIFYAARKKYYRSPVKGSVITQLIAVFRAAWKNRKRPLPAHLHLSPSPGSETLPVGSASTTAPHNWLDKALLPSTTDTILNNSTITTAATTAASTTAPTTEDEVVVPAINTETAISDDAVENAKALWRVLPIFAVFPVFWMLFDQQSSSWTLQADEMKLHGLQPEQIGVFNPVLIMILLPLFDRVIYPTIARCGCICTPLRRMGIGMIISVLAFLLSAGVQYKISISPPRSISVFMQLPQVLLISIAEVLISVTGLEFAYTQATPALKSIITSLFLITTAIGNIFTGILYQSLASHLDSTQMYLVFSGIMIVNFLLFLLVSSQYQPVVILDDRVRGTEEEEETEEERQMGKRRRQEGKGRDEDQGQNSIDRDESDEAGDKDVEAATVSSAHLPASTSSSSSASSSAPSSASSSRSASRKKRSSAVQHRTHQHQHDRAGDDDDAPTAATMMDSIELTSPPVLAAAAAVPSTQLPPSSSDPYFSSSSSAAEHLKRASVTSNRAEGEEVV